MAKRNAGVMREADSDGETKLFAFFATFLTIIGFAIALLVKRDNQYVMFYAKQGLILFIIQIIALLAGMLPLIGKFAYWIILVIFVVVWIMAWINALSGEMRNTWLIGNLARKIRL